MEKLRTSSRTATARSSAQDEAPPLADHAAVGNGQAVALISSAGDVAWCRFPGFDGELALGKLLDRTRGGSLALDPIAGGDVRRERAYEVGANVLISTIRTENAVATLTDGLIPQRSVLVRHAYGAQGGTALRVAFRPDARVRGAVRQVSRTELRVPAAPGSSDDLALTAPAPWKRSAGGTWRSTATVEVGRSAIWAIGVAADLHAAEADGLGRCLRSAIQRDRAWSSRIQGGGEYADAVRRSALALRLLLDFERGGLVSAPSASPLELSEPPGWIGGIGGIGGAHARDPRSAGFRDAARILAAWIQLGLDDSARKCWTWLERVAAQGVRRDGNATLLEAAAVRQRDLPVPCADLAPALRSLADDSALHWHEPARDRWASRGPERHFVHSKLMSWVALDRACHLAERGWLGGDASAWRGARDACRRAILERGFDKRRGAFVRAFGSDELDASALLVPLVGLLPASDPRVLSTLDVLGRELGEGELMRRFQPPGAEEREGSSLACSFRWVEALASAGHIDRAREHFVALLGRRNDVGLLAEQVDPETGAFLGGFPGVAAHLGLVRAAGALRHAARDADRPGSRPAV